MTWRISIETADEAGANRAAAALEAMAPAVTAFETAPGGAWRVEGFAEAAPDRAALALVEAVAGSPVEVERLRDRDWLQENQASFPPLGAGRFFVHGSHVTDIPGGGIWPILVDATTAFGTGEHATTRGCLLALQRFRPRRVLDMGTGTGILAIAAIRAGAREAIAVDIDPGSVRVAEVNIRRNGVAASVAAFRSDGYRDRRIARAAPFDLVLANILARPLARMAPMLARSLAPGGVAILSGLLARQEPFVLAAHRAQHLALERRIAIEGWHTLVLRKR
jgi:ribosomal protein L11 methyltransferase